MIKVEDALTQIPDGLKKPLLSEFNKLVNNFLEHRWESSELSGGRFCEIVYCILEGYITGNYASPPKKPLDFVGACRKLESNTSIPRSFQILIPRLLPAIYEIRNNRNVGHVGGDVNPDFMDSSIVISTASWILAELIRVYHNLSTNEAQLLVNSLIEHRTFLVWKSDNIRRVLNPKIPLADTILILVYSCNGKARIADILVWTEAKNKTHFNKVLNQLHMNRLIDVDRTTSNIALLPPGSKRVAEILKPV